MECDLVRQDAAAKLPGLYLADVWTHLARMIHRISMMAVAAVAAAAGLIWSSDFHPSAAEAVVQDAPAVADLPLIDEKATCEAPAYEQAALANAASLRTLRHAPFGRAENGWETYAPKVAAEIGAECAPDSPGFARALADWQDAQGLAPDGLVTAELFARMKTRWQEARSYVALRASGVCPDAPLEASLTSLTSDEGYKGKAILLRDDVARAYRAMVEAARAEVPEIASDPEAMDIFSGFRSPAYDAARCARDGNCGGVTRAKCSAHRTGYTFDLVVGAAPGHSVDSTNDENRLHMSRTPAYRWLVANAARFGFVNYVFEPWHWEYVGQGGTPGVIQASN